jgi:hypothetical protein
MDKLLFSKANGPACEMPKNILLNMVEISYAFDRIGKCYYPGVSCDRVKTDDGYLDIGKE